MIYHSLRVAFKGGVPQDRIDFALAHWRRMGEEIPAVSSYCVGRDVGGSFHYGAVFVLKDIGAYEEYMLAPIHREMDDIGLPLVEDMVSYDLTDDSDPEIGDKIRQVHASRFANDPELLGLIQDLGSYSGSGVPATGIDA